MRKGLYWVPRSKDDLVRMIVQGGWNGTKQELRDMDKKQLYAVFHKMRQSALNSIMRATGNVSINQTVTG